MTDKRIIGRSRAWRRAQESVELLAVEGYSCPLEGPSGSGKEVLARAYHDATGRTGRFEAVNCGAIPADLFESEMFGYARGAHSTAAETKPGSFEIADGGTLFLDEVHALSSSCQVKLLRAIQERAVRRLGSTRDVRVDVRIVTATNRDLWGEVEDWNFLEDLYHRLYQVDPVRVPGLDERHEDIGELAQLCLDLDEKGLALSVGAIAELASADYSRGQVRALFRSVRRAYLAARREGSERIEARHVSSEPGPQSERDTVERAQILSAMSESALAKAMRVGRIEKIPAQYRLVDPALRKKIVGA